MATPGSGRDDEIRGLLINALEVQLAAFRAGIRFWEGWIGEASKFVNSATDKLHALENRGTAPRDTLLEVVDAARGSIRSMMELPGDSASHFIEELERITKRGPAAASGARGARKKRPARKRAARIKN